MTDLPIGEYSFIPTEKVIYGQGVLNQLAEEVQRLGGKNVVVICSNSLYTSSYVEKMKKLLGDKLTSVLSGTKEHTLSQSVFDIASKIKDKEVDLLISLGGGTVIDTTKAVGLVLGESLNSPEQLRDYSVKFEYGKDTEIPALEKNIVAHIAIPTTLSAAEFSNIIGITDEEKKVKELYIDDKVTPKVVFLDPEVTIKTPRSLWLASGIRALDHAIETIYSKQKQPITTTLGIEAIKKLKRYLPECERDPDNIHARLQCQLAAWMSFFGVSNVMMGLSHGIGHQIGSHAGVSHGVTSCIILPHVMRFSIPETIEEQAIISEAMGADVTGKSTEEIARQAPDLVENMVKQLKLPTKLQEVYVSKDQFTAIAADAMKDMVVASSPRAVNSKGAIIKLLEKAW